MSYVTGSAVDLAALNSALFNACVTNGWTLASPVLSKGELAMKIDQVTVSSITGLRFTGGTGASGATLTGASPSFVELGTRTNLALSFPLTYHLFLFSNPDEVYLVVNYNVDTYQWAAWGQSTLDLPGTGMWFGSMISGGLTGGVQTLYLMANGDSASHSYTQPALFWRSFNYTASAANSLETIIHHGLDSIGWTTGASTAPGASAIWSANPLLSMLPNSWNSEAVLLPIQAAITRPSSMSSLVATPVNARYTRIDNYEPRQVITIGNERWMVLPWLKKNASVRNGVSGVSTNLHSGTLGWAIRYDGA